MTLQIDRPIVLIGLMGAGKSTVGQRLAEKLEINFVDIDHRIEEKTGKSITEIFSDEGEQYFRDIEKETIKEELEKEVQVIATGGAAFINDQTRQLIKEKATSIWLRAGIDMLVERVSRKDNRPLLAGCDKRKILEELIEKRHPIYAEADLIVESDEGAHYKIVEQIIWKL